MADPYSKTWCYHNSALAAAEFVRLRTALSECAAEWKTEPGTVIDCFNQTRAEFIRRMKVADAALSPQQPSTERGP